MFYRSIRSGFILAFLPAAQRQNEVVIEVIVKTVATLAHGGYDVVVDGIVGPWFSPPFRMLVEHDHLVVSYLVLRPSLHAAFEQLGDLEGQAIDTGGLDAEQTTAEVWRGLASGHYRLR